MPNASVAGVPRKVIQEWKNNFLNKKEQQQKTDSNKLTSGEAQYTYNGITYTAKYSGGANKAGIKYVSFPQASYESKVEGARSRKGEQQKIKLSSIEQMIGNNFYEDARFLSNLLGQEIVVDHSMPINKNGFSNDPNNFQLLTAATNSKKSDSLEYYNAALEESKYLSELVFKERSKLDSNGGSIKLNVNAIMTRANMPALGGFQNAEIGPYQTPQRTEKPAQATLQEKYTLPEQPLEPKVDMSPSVMETVSDVVETATPYVVGASAAVGGLMLNMAQGAASLLFNVPGP